MKKSETAECSGVSMELSVKNKKKGSGARLWMRMNKLGQSEVIECDKSTIVKRLGVPARALRLMLSPYFSHSSTVLGNLYRIYYCILSLNPVGVIVFHG